MSQCGSTANRDTASTQPPRCLRESGCWPPMPRRDDPLADDVGDVEHVVGKLLTRQARRAGLRSALTDSIRWGICLTRVLVHTGAGSRCLSHGLASPALLTRGLASQGCLRNPARLGVGECCAQRPFRFAILLRGWHRDQFLFRIAQCRQTTAEDAAGVDADGAVDPLRITTEYGHRRRSPGHDTRPPS